MALMPFWLLSIFSPSFKSSYLAKPRTPHLNSFNTTLPMFSPTLDYPEQLSLTEGRPSFPDSPKRSGNSSQSRRSPPLLITHKPMVRRNVLIKNSNILQFYCNYQQDNWSLLLPLAQFVMNSRFHSGIQNTPFYLMLGYTPQWQQASLPLDNPSASDQVSQLDNARHHAIAALH